MSRIFQRQELTDYDKLCHGLCPPGPFWRGRKEALPTRQPQQFLKALDRSGYKESWVEDYWTILSLPGETRDHVMRSDELLSAKTRADSRATVCTMCTAERLSVHVDSSGALGAAGMGLSTDKYPIHPLHIQSHGKTHPSLQRWQLSPGPNGCTVIKVHQSTL